MVYFIKALRISIYNLKKTISSIRVLTVLLIVAGFILQNLEAVLNFSNLVGVRITPYAFPHLTNDYICQLVIMAGVIFIFSNAPYEDDGYFYILLCAPTGIARRRMRECTEYPALTIHKSIGLTGEAGEEEWKNEQPIPDDLIIADEFSMVDMYLADKLFASIKSGARLVLVGDKDQIESVGPGKVFQEIIDSGVFPVTVLDECFRQEGNSTISQNAIKINKNQLDLVFDDTFQFIPASTPEEASRKIQKIYRKEVLQRNGSLEEVQVMSPLRKDTEAGTDALNLVLRDIANPKRFGYPEITNGRNTYREGDRVMQTKNNDEVANGDIGEVIGIFRKDQKMVMRVDFGDGRVMEYQEEDYWPLTLAYAITVHKAQGSEYPMAILPMLPCFRWMLRRNIFYTAVTRARERFIIVGSKRAIAQAIRTDYISRRNTMFGYRIRKIYEAILEQEKSA